VTRGPIRDVAASVRQRLLNRARATNRPFQELLQYFAMERFLYRLSRSPHVSRFVLKGARLVPIGSESVVFRPPKRGKFMVVARVAPGTRSPWAR
jgi:hypothetical protein